MNIQTDEIDEVDESNNENTTKEQLIAAKRKQVNDEKRKQVHDKQQTRHSSNLSSISSIFMMLLVTTFIFIIAIVIYQKIFSTTVETPETTQPTEKILKSLANTTQLPSSSAEKSVETPVTDEKDEEVAVDENVDKTSEEVNWSVVGKQLILLEEQRQQIIKLAVEKLAATD